LVTVEELLILVKIALSNANVSICEAVDANGGEPITVDEILTAANNTLDGCHAGLISPTLSSAPSKAR